MHNSQWEMKLKAFLLKYFFFQLSWCEKVLIVSFTKKLNQLGCRCVMSAMWQQHVSRVSVHSGRCMQVVSLEQISVGMSLPSIWSWKNNLPATKGGHQKLTKLQQCSTATKPTPSYSLVLILRYSNGLKLEYLLALVFCSSLFNDAQLVYWFFQLQAHPNHWFCCTCEAADVFNDLTVEQIWSGLKGIKKLSARSWQT